jgi:uncharacterized membrane protein YqjE
MAESVAHASSPDPAGASPGPPQAEDVPPPSAPSPASLLQSLQLLWRDLPGLVSDRVELLSLELQRAGVALVQIVGLVVAAAILGVTAWLVLWGGIVILLWSLGLHLAWALLTALLVNLLVAMWAVRRVRQLLPQLRLPATRRHLMFGPGPDAEPEPAPLPIRVPPTAEAPAESHAAMH